MKIPVNGKIQVSQKKIAGQLEVDMNFLSTKMGTKTTVQISLAT